jgi:hypothetical protein
MILLFAFVRPQVLMSIWLAGFDEGWGGEIKPTGDPIRPRKYEI